MSEQEASLSVQMQELAARMGQMQTELDRLKTRAASLPHPPPATAARPGVSTSRRKLLRRLAGGLVAGLAAGSAALVLDPSISEAKMVISPATGNGQVGAIIVPPGKDVPTGSPINGIYFGLVTTDGSALNMSDPASLPNLIRDYNTAILGYSAVTDGNGLVGYAPGSYSYGIAGFSDGSFGTGVYGQATKNSGYGVYGDASGTSSYGVYGTASNTGSYAGYFDGNVNISGTLNATSATASVKNFKIDHPLDPANKYLYHTSIESSDMMNLYNGIATLDGQGEATVTMPDWFEALNTDFRYQLTSIGVSMPGLFIAEKLSERRFKIAGGKAGQEVSWQVTGIRQDAYAQAHRSPVEEDKTGDEKGKYIHPELFGQPKEMSVSPRPPAKGGASR